MTTRRALIPLMLTACLATLVSAQDQAAPPPPPLLDDSAQVTRELMEPQVTIIEREGERIEEFRLQGELYMIRVQPENAPAYYLVDMDGDGRLETRMHELDPKILIPSWVIFRF
ncbi:DUF2782 domain-containing protein [Ectothiorhodospira variabilis]|uniref:DUF2782 domain-containing protein n=1 Tax=Ectothiorhodospira variabilis TaxID=505694 RepID=UPI001EFA81A4|nr:DUF2782 domain-containing protein [Ectothiorhodospira variabilis]MCG5494738.1 DUF2782 domain-containing protein [Ectothiorhodospira variabilis]MCG5503498.1 DUF2782 domain-containing protein [Ectothiorhodospira variabilis]MCG5506787.1 DUF2782 domain-containing protein [Ectothiorhodospira variabilis]